MRIPAEIGVPTTPKPVNWDLVLSIAFGLLIFAAITSRAVYDASHPQRYAGTVSEIKGEKSGVIIDLDGEYPNQKMTIWVRKEVAMQLHGHWPAVGSTLTVMGPITHYRGRPEIIVNEPTQMVAETSAPASDPAATESSDSDPATFEEDTPETGTFLNVFQIDWLVAIGLGAMVLFTTVVCAAGWLSRAGRQPASTGGHGTV